MSQRTPDLVVEAPSGLGVTAISRRSAKDSVVDEIRSSIMRGALKAGVRIIEHKLAIDLNVSQTTVREALVDLEHLGFVQRVPPRKTFVTRLTHRDIDEIYAVRVPLEQVAIDLLAAIPTPDLANAEKASEGMRRAAAAEDRIRFESMDLEFHRALWAATENRTLAATLEKIVVKLFAFGFVMNQQIHASRSRMEEQAGQHGRILALIKGHDFQAAKNLMAASMDKTWLDDIEFAEENTTFDSDERETLSDS
ncbi:MAG: GntR family transcriptional regulator [Bryobacteraceae bacterium]